MRWCKSRTNHNMGLIRIQFDQTPDMAYDMAMHLWKRNRTLKWGLTLLALVGVGLIISYFLQPERSSEALLTAALPLTMIVILWRLFIPFTLKLQAKLANRSSNVGQHRDLTFADDAIHIKTSHSSVTFEYGGIIYWDESPKNYFLYIAKNQGFVIPKAAFNVGDEARFLGLLEHQQIPQAKR